jgi:hypothetical protein
MFERILKIIAVSVKSWVKNSNFSSVTATNMKISLPQHIFTGHPDQLYCREILANRACKLEI